MAIVQKTITLEVKITVDVDEDLIGTPQVDDPWAIAGNVAYGMQYMDECDELYEGATVHEYSAIVVDVTDTDYVYPQQ